MTEVKNKEERANLVAAVRSAFEAEQIPWFRALVEQPSCTREPQDVEAAARLVDQAMVDLGFPLARHADSEGRFADHRVYRRHAPEPAVALVGHVDTVFPRSLGFFGFRREGDQVFGPGVLDMKSGLSVVVFGLRALRAAARDAFDGLRVCFVCVSDEEVGSPSSRDLYAQLAPTLRRALVFEGGRTEDRVVTGRKGGAFFRLKAEGRAAHAGNHHRDGVNAIAALAPLVAEVEALTDYDCGVTCNVGVIRGGTAKNTVPDAAEMEIDVRFVDPSDGERIEHALRALAASEPPVVGASLRLEGEITRPPMRPTAEAQLLRHHYEACAAEVGLRVGEAPLQGGGSDANLLSSLGVPSIDGLGPYGRHFHRTDEWSSLESLRARTEALALFLWDEAHRAVS
ncbi:MAG: M20/M25/M40 family metallo-hydrolase [Myxococcota bacterium]